MHRSSFAFVRALLVYISAAESGDDGDDNAAASEVAPLPRELTQEYECLAGYTYCDSADQPWYCQSDANHAIPFCDWDDDCCGDDYCAWWDAGRCTIDTSDQGEECPPGFTDCGSFCNYGDDCVLQCEDYSYEGPCITLYSWHEEWTSEGSSNNDDTNSGDSDDDDWLGECDESDHEDGAHLPTAGFVPLVLLFGALPLVCARCCCMEKRTPPNVTPSDKTIICTAVAACVFVFNFLSPCEWRALCSSLSHDCANHLLTNTSPPQKQSLD